MKQFAAPLGMSTLHADLFDEILNHNPTEGKWSETEHFLYYTVRVDGESTLTTTGETGVYQKRSGGKILQHIFSKELWDKDEAWAYLEGLAEKALKGGEGSGHHGHTGGEGGKGKPGGSRPRGDTVAIRAYEAIRKEDGTYNEKYSQYKGDATYAEMAKQLGYDAKPQIGSQAELDKTIVDGGTELYRGFSSQEHQEQFVKGEFFGSNGVYGAGVYFGHGADAKQTASLYALEGGPIRAVLPKTAKVGHWEALCHQMEKERVERKREFGRLRLRDEAGWRRAKALSAIYEDVGRFAALKGYDAFIGSTRELIVLNRGVLVVEK